MMKVKEDELIERLMNENEEFRMAKQTHSELAKKLDDMENKPYLTPQDEVEIKILKKKNWPIRTRWRRFCCNTDKQKDGENFRRKI